MRRGLPFIPAAPPSPGWSPLPSRGGRAHPVVPGEVSPLLSSRMESPCHPGRSVTASRSSHPQVSDIAPLSSHPSGAAPHLSPVIPSGTGRSPAKSSNRQICQASARRAGDMPIPFPPLRSWRSLREASSPTAIQPGTPLAKHAKGAKKRAVSFPSTRHPERRGAPPLLSSRAERREAPRGRGISPPGPPPRASGVPGRRGVSRSGVLRHILSGIAPGIGGNRNRDGLR